MLDTYFNAASTSNANNHLAKAIRGHSIRPDGPIRIHSKEGNIPNAIARLLMKGGDANMMLLYLVATNVGDNRAEEGR
jgi:hypothetical protein